MLSCFPVNYGVLFDDVLEKILCSSYRLYIYICDGL